MNNRLVASVILLVILLFQGCGTDQPGLEEDESVALQLPPDPLFTLIDPAESGLSYFNELREDATLNILTYEYLYNGSGVAVGDINNDGLPDVFMGGNLFGGRLFLNKGNLKFEQISESAGVFVQGYTTGVSMVDVNADGWLDIYLCRSLVNDPTMRANVLLINNGDLTFTDRAAEFGLADKSFSNQASFFDYDNDGDLDMYLLNHRVDFKEALTIKTYTDSKGEVQSFQDTSYQYVSDKMYQNNGNGTFTDVTKKAGLVNRAFGLSATAADINQDGWMDVYVANDYADKDRFYINNGNGTFTDKIETMFFHTSKNAMGSDIADFNNDGLLDLINLDMVPADNHRQKQLKGPGAYDLYHMAVKYGLTHQVMRNTLQLNNGNGTFSEIGQLAGVSHTEWSWTPLMADFDNDGHKDLFISNGYYRDVTDMDYLMFESNKVLQDAGGLPKAKALDLVKKAPSNPVSNVVFQNNGNLTFSDKTDDWGLSKPSISNGSVYADLDLDGDLDLISNNLNEPAFLYRNNATELNQNHYLSIRLEGTNNNPDGVGTKVTVTTSEGTQFQEASPYRGYFSSQQPLLHFGLGQAAAAASVKVVWPNGKSQELIDLKINTTLELKLSEATDVAKSNREEQPLMVVFGGNLFPGYRHKEDDFIDFKREPLLEHMLSNKGPFVAAGDVDGDGREDLYFGGAAGQIGELFLQRSDLKFSRKGSVAFGQDKGREDGQSAFFDADGDGDLDLYVTSGGAAFSANSENYQDRLYLNNGQGNFGKVQSLPSVFENSSCVEAHDFDGDGDTDLFVGGGVLPGSYPHCSVSRLLSNDKGVFTDVSDRLPNGGKLGMVNDAAWMDCDGDGVKELVVAGEWMPITILKLEGQQLKDITEKAGLANSSGWWNCLEMADFDNDGDLDIVAGNRGENSFYKASVAESATIYAKDFDDNGSIDALPFYYFNDHQSHPKHTLDEVAVQYPAIRRKFNRYQPYSHATLNTIFSESDLQGALTLSAQTFSTSIFINNGDGTFTGRALPVEAQFSEVHGLLPTDINADGNLDLLVAGNNYGSDVEMGRSDASIGCVLLGDGTGQFTPMSVQETGFSVLGDSRGMTLVNKGSHLVVLRNGDIPAVFRLP